METATAVSVCGFVPASLAAERRCAAGVVVFKADEQAGELCIFCLQRTLSSLPPSILLNVSRGFWSRQSSCTLWPHGNPQSPPQSCGPAHCRAQSTAGAGLGHRGALEAGELPLTPPREPGTVHPW